MSVLDFACPLPLSPVWTSQCHRSPNSFSTCGVCLSFERSSVTSSRKSWRVRSPLPLPPNPARHKTTCQLKVGHQPKPCGIFWDDHNHLGLRKVWRSLKVLCIPGVSVCWQTSSSEHFRSRPLSGTSLNQSEGREWTQLRFRRCAASACSTRRLCLHLRKSDSRYSPVSTRFLLFPPNIS